MVDRKLLWKAMGTAARNLGMAFLIVSSGILLIWSAVILLILALQKFPGWLVIAVVGSLALYLIAVLIEYANLRHKQRYG